MFDLPSFGKSFDEDVRAGFVRKVFGIVSTQLTATAIICLFATVSDAFFEFQLNNFWIYIVAAIGTIVTYSMLVCSCCGNYQREYPMNMILLGIFTLCEAYTLSSLCAFFTPFLVASAIGITAAMTLGVLAFATAPSTNLISSARVISILAMALTCSGILLIFVRIPMLEWFYLLGGLVVYGFSLAFHFQLVIGNKLGVEFGVDDYIQASLVLYLDIVRIFVRILILLAKLTGKEGERKKK